jgi:hypothetical protein
MGVNLRRARPAWFYGWLAAWGVAAACGRADDSPPAMGAPPLAPDGAPGAVDSGTAAGQADASSTPSIDASPAPNDVRWTRGVEGLCVPYEDEGERQANWRVFATEAECERSCNCSLLECACSGVECPSTIERAAQNLCAPPNNNYEPPYSVVQRTGCGQVYLTSSNGFAGRGWLFALNAASDAGAASSASLVGSMSFVDVDTEPCAMYSWSVGESFDCPEAVACQVCGVTLGPTLPACD